MNNISKNKRILSIFIAMLVALSFTFGDILAVWADAGEVSADAAAEVYEDTDEASSGVASLEERLYYEQAAMDAFSPEDGDSSADAEETETNFITRLLNTIKGKWITNGSNLLNLRSAAKRTSEKYGILQGCCTDGQNYVYFAFNRKSDDRVKVVKMRITENQEDPSKVSLKYVACTETLSRIRHGNDMAYVKNAGGSGLDRILIITSNSGGKSGTYIGMIDVASMKELKGKSFNYWSDLSECDPECYPADTTVKTSKRKTLEELVGDHHGYSTIAYNEKTDLIAATVKTDRDLLILRPVWTAEGKLSALKLQRYIRQNKNNATSQGIDADDNFIYTVWSAMAGKLDANILQVYDWEGNHIGDRTIGKSYEMESVFHLGEGSDARFYATFYNSYVRYYKVKQKYKVKWKKVKKKYKVKVKVKIKKGKNKGKYKYKYKTKTKKVWKYKTKYRYITKSTIERDAHIMYLGPLTETVEDMAAASEGSGQ